MKKNFSNLLLIISLTVTLTTCKKQTDNSTPSKWEKINFPNAVTVNFLITSGTTIYAATSGGVFYSINNGDSWVEKNDGLPQNKNICALTVIGQNIFAGIKDTNAIFSSSFGNSWILSNNGIPYSPQNPGNYNIIGLYSNSTHIFACTQNAGIYRSSNFGSDWTSSNNGFPVSPSGYSPTSLTFLSYVSDSIVFAGFKYGGASGTASIYRSNNNGVNWTEESNGLPTGLPIYSMTTVGVTIKATSDSGRIYESFGGFDYYLMPLVGQNIVHQLTYDSIALDSLTYYAATSGGLYLMSLNGPGNPKWTKESSQSELGEEMLDIRSIIINGSTIFIVGDNSQISGVWKSSL